MYIDNTGTIVLRFNPSHWLSHNRPLHMWYCSFGAALLSVVMLILLVSLRVSRLAHMLETFQIRCLRKIQGLFWANSITNRKMLLQTDITPLVACVPNVHWCTPKTKRALRWTRGKEAWLLEGKKHGNGDESMPPVTGQHHQAGCGPTAVHIVLLLTPCEWHD